MHKIEGTHLIVDAYVKDVKTLEEANMLALFDEPHLPWGGDARDQLVPSLRL